LKVRLKGWASSLRATNAGESSVSTILIADDHAVVRAGYKQFLEAEAGITEVGEAASGDETLGLLRRKRWNLLLLDIHMPRRSGLDILKHVKSGYPHVSVLIMSGLPEEQYARNVLRAGASGYLSKGGSVEELLKAVRTIFQGRRYVSQTLAEAMAADLVTPEADNHPPHGQLSARQFQVFCKLASGAAIGDIAAELSLSVKTVSTYRTQVLEKMQMTSNANMTSYALRTGLIQ
jgi:DNA-binding NarL/FixJ family response regulator